MVRKKIYEPRRVYGRMVWPEMPGTLKRKVTKARKSAIMKKAARLRKQGITPRQALKQAWKTT